MDYFTCLFPYEQLNFKSNKANYCFQNKIAHKKIYKQTNLKKGFKTASENGEKKWVIQTTNLIEQQSALSGSWCKTEYFLRNNRIKFQANFYRRSKLNPNGVDTIIKKRDPSVF